MDISLFEANYKKRMSISKQNSKAMGQKRLD